MNAGNALFLRWICKTILDSQGTGSCKSMKLQKSWKDLEEKIKCSRMNVHDGKKIWIQKSR